MTLFAEFCVVDLQHREPVVIVEVLALIGASLLDFDVVDANIVHWNCSFEIQAIVNQMTLSQEKLRTSTIFWILGTNHILTKADSLFLTWNKR